MESNKECLNQKIFIYILESTVCSTNIIGYWICKKIAHKERFNHSNVIHQPFQNKLKLTRNEAIPWVLVYGDQQYKDYKLVKLGIEAGIISDTDDSSKSVYPDATDPYYLPAETELFEVWNKILGTKTIKIMNLENLRYFVLVEDLIKNG